MIDPEVIARIAERKILEAIEEGKFDNLPGSGQPLVFEDDAGVPLHIRMANKVLKNAGGLPDWMMVQNDIVTERAEIERLRVRLAQDGQTRRAKLHSLPATHPDIARFAAWHARERAAYLRRLKSVNTSILKFAMSAPSTAPAYASYKIERVMAEFDEAFPTLEQARHLTPLVAEPESKLRSLARERYRQGGGEVRGWAKAAGRLGLGRAQSAGQPGAAASDDSANALGSALEGGMDHEDIKRADAPDGYKQP